MPLRRRGARRRAFRDRAGAPVSAPHPIPADVRHELAVLVHRFRRTVDGPDWDVPGIKDALARCGGEPCHIAAAAFASAANPEHRTPGMIPLPGAHWPVVGGERVEPARSYNMRCHDHGDQEIPCATCRAEYTPASPDTVQAAMATIRADLAAHQPRPARPAPLGTRRLIEGGGQ